MIEHAPMAAPCRFCGALTHGPHDLLCSPCWKTVPKPTKREFAAVFAQLPLPDRATVHAAEQRLLAVMHGAPPTEADMLRELPVRKVSRTCTECARDFEYVPGVGRPPFRCPACRAASKPAPRPAKAAPVVTLTPAHPPGNVHAGFIATLRAEIVVHEAAIALRQDAIRALEALAATPVQPPPAQEEPALDDAA